MVIKAPKEWLDMVLDFEQSPDAIKLQKLRRFAWTRLELRMWREEKKKFTEEEVYKIAQALRDSLDYKTLPDFHFKSEGEVELYYDSGTGRFEFSYNFFGDELKTLASSVLVVCHRGGDR